MNIEDFKGTFPVLLPEQFFNGDLEGWAIILGPLGGLQKRATIKARGSWDWKTKMISLIETWTLDDGSADTLTWSIHAEGNGSYVGMEPTLEGKAQGHQAGCAYHWKYTRDVPGKDKPFTRLNFDDWFFAIDDRTVIAKGTAGRLGLPFASGQVLYRKVSGKANGLVQRWSL